ncbi:hypothetical protein CAPTEDRAFT_97806, partial [Capitella teleta]
MDSYFTVFLFFGAAFCISGFSATAHSFCGTCECSRTVVNCSGRNIDHLPTHNIKGIQGLDLSFNNISNFPEHFFRGFLSLQMLNMSYNRIQSIHPNTFASLRNLTHLELANTSLTAEILEISVFGALKDTKIETLILAGLD